MGTTREQYRLETVGGEALTGWTDENDAERLAGEAMDRGALARELVITRRVVCTGCDRPTSQPHARNCPNVHPSADPAL
jgi:hypothetical protein